MKQLNVGIGTPTPATKLDVIGSIASTGLITGVGVTSTGAITSTGTITSSSPTLGVGYGTGAGGTIAQLTSRITPVTINKICGSITLVNAAGSITWSSFTVNNTTVGATDTILLSYSGGSNTYLFLPGKIIGGTSFIINFVSIIGTAVDQPTINFTIIKSVTL